MADEKKSPKGFSKVGDFIQDPRKGLAKQAGGGGLGGGNMQLATSRWYTPELTSESWLLPKSRQEVIKWVNLNWTDYASHKSLKDLKIGDSVLTSTGKTLEISNKIESIYTGKAVKIRLNKVSVDPLEFSYGHPMLAIHCPLYDARYNKMRRQLANEAYKSGEELISRAKMMPAEKLEKGDYLVIPKYSKTELLPNLFGVGFEWSEDIFELFGWYAAEGYSNRNNSICMQLGSDEYPICERLKKIAETHFLGCISKIKFNGKHPRISVNLTNLGKIFDFEFGHGARNKRIPEWILNAEPKYVAAFLRGWMGGDGHLAFDNPNRLRANVITVSRELADWGFLLFTKLGILPSFGKRALDPEKITFTGGVHPKTTAPFAYILSTFGQDVKKIWPDVKWNEEETFTKYLSDSKYLYIPIKDVEHFDYSGPAYDILTADQTYAIPVVSYACATHGKVVENFGPKEIESLDVGQKVLSIFGEQKSIVDKISRPYKGQVNDITPVGFETKTLTELDAVYGIKVKRAGWDEKDSGDYVNALRSGEVKFFDKLSWITASILEPGDLLAVPKFREVRDITIDLSNYIVNQKNNWEKYEINGDSIIVSKKDVTYTIPRFVQMTPAFSRFIGRYFSSGSINSSIILYGDVVEKDIKWLLDLGMPKSLIIADKARTTISFTLIANFLNKEIGEGSRYDKKIPDFLIYAESDSVSSFLDVLFEKRHGRKTDKVTMTEEIGYKLLFLGTKCNRLFSIKKFPITRYVFLEEMISPLSDAGFFFIPVEKNIAHHFDGDLHHITVDSGTIAVPFIIHNCRIFFNLEPYIQSICTLHSRYPFSKFKLVHPDRKVRQKFEDMCFSTTWDLYDHILKSSLSYQVYGESINFGNWDEKKKVWSRFVLLEPEVVEVHQDIYDEVPQYELIPTEELKKLVNSPDPKNVDRRGKLPEIVVEAIRANKNIPLDPKATSIIARITSPSAIRGTPVLQSLFKVLIFQDYIRLAQMRIAERHTMPFELWSLGSLEHKILPTDEDLEKVRNMINDAIQNPPFVMVYPPILKYEALGVKDRLLNIYEDLGYVENQILVGLGVNKNLILGEGPSFSNVKTMALHRLIMEYQTVRDLFERWIYNHVFRRVAEENDFWEYTGEEKKLAIPKIEWEKSLNVEEEEVDKKFYIDLHKSGFVSTQTLFTKFPNLDYEHEKKLLEEERTTVFDKGNDRLATGKGAGAKPAVPGAGAPKPAAPPAPAAPPPAPTAPPPGAVPA